MTKIQTRGDGGGDSILSADAFKLTRWQHRRAVTWQLHALTPWARAWMTASDPAEHRGEYVNPRAGSRQGWRFGRKADALSAAETMARTASRWGA
jgi:hypothetical protein